MLSKKEILAQPEPRCPLCEFQYFSRSIYEPRGAYREFAKHLEDKHDLWEFPSWDLIEDFGRDRRIINRALAKAFR